MNGSDSVARVIKDWNETIPDLDVTPIAVMARIAKIRAIALAKQDAIFREHDLTPADFVAVVTLRRRAQPYRLTQSELAQELGLTAGTVSIRVDRLIKLGLATRTRSGDDARVQWIELTAHGEAVFNDVVPQHLEAERHLLAGLSEADRTELARILQRWLADLEESVGEEDR